MAECRSQEGRTKTGERREVRCECGNLVAKLMPSGLQLKCRRCKRLAIIPFDQFEGNWNSISIQW